MVVSQEKAVDKGGMVHGVPCADPKCLMLRSIRHEVISSGSVICLPCLACLGGVLSLGISMWFTSEFWLGLIVYLIFANDRRIVSIFLILLIILAMSLSRDRARRCSSLSAIDALRIWRTSLRVCFSICFSAGSDSGMGIGLWSRDWSASIDLLLSF